MRATKTRAADSMRQRWSRSLLVAVGLGVGCLPEPVDDAFLRADAAVPELCSVAACVADTDAEPEPARVSEEPPAPAPATSRKRAALGMGLAGPRDWSTEFPFLDLMKLSRDWYDWERDVEVTTVDEHGWLTSLEPGVRAGTVFLTNPENGPVPYPNLVVRWEGRGSVSYDWSARKRGTRNGADLVECGGGSCLLRVDAVDPDDPIRNITIVPEEHVAAFDRGEQFNPDFLSRVGVFRAVRFMDWMDTNGSTQATWSDRPRVNDRTWAEKGVPLEVMIDLANTINADAWFNVPHLANDDYVRRFARGVHARLAPHLVAYVEHSNEVWNWQFPQAHHALEAAKARWGKHGDGFMQWHGMRTARICDLFKREVFAKDAERVHCVLGTQAGYPGLEQPALRCPLFAAEGHEPCHAHGIDSLGIAGYFSGCLEGVGFDDRPETERIRSWFGDADGGLTRAFEQLATGKHFRCEDSLPKRAEAYAYFKRVASGLGLALVAYEGGQHITSNGFPTEGDPAFLSFHLALNRDARMRDAYLQNLRHWREQGGSLFMHYMDIGPATRYGSWGALESISEPNSPKWGALTGINSEPCWWPDC